MLYKLVQFVHVDIGKELTGQISDGESLPVPGIKKAFLRRYFLEIAPVTLQDIILRAVMIYKYRNRSR
ncbi:MAG: hypothetical protein DRP37_04430 [Thermodesulfobacteriota bacterium]|nr:MAG: hypothetical protein DRP37_04430 [Thermodesulfobacteriota bacterium]